jgi:hypothetical protein
VPASTKVCLCLFFWYPVLRDSHPDSAVLIQAFIKHAGTKSKNPTFHSGGYQSVHEERMKVGALLCGFFNGVNNNNNDRAMLVLAMNYYGRIDDRVIS